VASPFYSPTKVPFGAAARPFYLATATDRIAAVNETGREAGRRPGDELIAIQDQPYRGESQSARDPLASLLMSMLSSAHMSTGEPAYRAAVLHQFVAAEPLTS
jgi:hypothetical protein